MEADAALSLPGKLDPMAPAGLKAIAVSMIRHMQSHAETEFLIDPFSFIFMIPPFHNLNVPAGINPSGKCSIYIGQIMMSIKKQYKKQKKMLSKKILVVTIGLCFVMKMMIRAHILDSGRLHGCHTQRAEGQDKERITAGQHTGVAHDGNQQGQEALQGKRLLF
jgi:hypothetical protein